MLRRLAFLAILPLTAVLPQTASAAAWSTVPLPRHTTLSSVSCRSTRWCEAIGGWQNRLQVAHWNGTRWSVTSDLPDPRGGVLFGLTCRPTNSCVAVGELFPHEYQPINPLIERWNGRRWRVESAPKPRPLKGYRGVNTRLYSVACPAAKLCFAVGKAVAFGAGNAPGVPLIERWDGRRWQLMRSPATADAPLESISCTSTRACTAVGGFEHEVGTPEANNQQIEYPATVEHWNGQTWSLGSLTTPTGASGAGLLGVSCTSASNCLGVGSAFEPGPDYMPGNNGGNDQAVAAPGDGTAFSASALAFPSSAYRSPSSPGNPTTVLGAISCATSTSCAAVGRYGATNGAIGPLVATWNGSDWTQLALRRGPVELTSVSCPARSWCMAVGSTIAERFRAHD